MNSKQAGTGTNERADGHQTTSNSAPKNDLLPNKPWIPEKQRWTNREALEVFQQKRAERAAKIAAGIPVSNLSQTQEDSIDLWVKSLTSGCHRVYSESGEEEEAFVQAIKNAVPGVELEKVSLLDIVNYYRPKSLVEGRQFFIQEYQDGRITDEDVKRIVAVVKQKRAEKGIDAIEEEEDRDEE